MATLVGNIQGPPGSEGAAGATGAQGPPGVDGAPGATGPTGPPGADSTVPGPEGPAGPAGPAGSGVTIEGSLPTPGPPPVTGTEDPGDMWIDSNGDGWVWTDPPGEWTNVGPIRGPEGPAGPTGPPGADSVVPGPTGPPGADGATGATGAAGADGAQGSRGTGWYTGAGAPVEPIAGSIVGDLYLDTTTGNVYTLAGA
jgi:hypothetical protein